MIQAVFDELLVRDVEKKNGFNKFTPEFSANLLSLAAEILLPTMCVELQERISNRISWPVSSSFFIV